MPPANSRKTTSKPVLARRTTRGPLDEEDDPLTASKESSLLSQDSSTTSPPQRSIELRPASTDATVQSPTITAGTEASHVLPANKDLSFLLETGIYHPLGQIDIPPAFRKAFPPPPAPGSTIDKILADLDALLGECHFIGAAHLCALALTSGIVASTDYSNIFKLLAIRYSSLELSGNTLLAAQESKALEDLSSNFYYIEDSLLVNPIDTEAEQKPLPHHIMPFHLRLQAVRLQSIGFSDARRGVSALYDLALECREHLESSHTNGDDLSLWQRRLEEVGIRVVNALVEIGDLDCARRTLDSMSMDAESKDGQAVARLVLLALKMGNLAEAKTMARYRSLSEQDRLVLHSLIDICRGRFEEALQVLSGDLGSSDLTIIARQNLAVAYLYTGRISQCRAQLEQLIREGYSFQSLTVNLATVYELSSDKARNLKMSLADKIAETEAAQRGKTYINADFKL